MYNFPVKNNAFFKNRIFVFFKFFLVYYLFVCLFVLGKRERVGKGQREEEREKFHVVSAGPDAGLELTIREITA